MPFSYLPAPSISVDDIIPSAIAPYMPRPSVRNIEKQTSAGAFGEDVYVFADDRSYIRYPVHLYPYDAPGTISFRCLLSPPRVDEYLLLGGPYTDIVAFDDPDLHIWLRFNDWSFIIKFPERFDRDAWLMFTLTWDTDGTALLVVDDEVLASTTTLTLYTPDSEPYPDQPKLPYAIGGDSDSFAMKPNRAVSDLVWLPDFTDPEVITTWYDKPRPVYPNALLQWGPTSPTRPRRHYRFSGGF